MKTEVILPIIAAVLALAALMVKDGEPPGKEAKREVPAGAFLVLGLLVGLLVVGSLSGYGGLDDALPLTLSFGIGCLLSVIAYGLGLMKGQLTAGRAAPIALGVLAPSLLVLLPYPGVPLAMVFGAAASAWFLSIGKEVDPNPWAMRAAIVAAFVVAANVLGKQANLGDYGPMAGTMLGLVAATAAVLSGFVATLAKSPGLRAGVAMALVSLGSWLIGDRLLHLGTILPIAAGGAVLAFIVAAVVPEDEEPSSMRLLVAVLIWVSAATAAFGFEKGFGMAVLALTSTAVLLASGNKRALLTMAPLGALVMYRVFRETHTDATKAFDIGQHYAMIGLIVGALLPVMAQEWLRTVSKRGGFLTLIAGALWIVVLLIAPITTAVVLGAKGVIGYLFGLGLAGVIEAVRGERSAHSMSLGLGMAGVMALIYDALLPHLDLDRDQKLVKMAYLGGGVLVLGIVIAVLSGEFTRSKEGNA